MYCWAFNFCEGLLQRYFFNAEMNKDLKDKSEYYKEAQYDKLYAFILKCLALTKCLCFVCFSSQTFNSLRSRRQIDGDALHNGCGRVATYVATHFTADLCHDKWCKGHKNDIEMKSNLFPCYSPCFRKSFVKKSVFLHCLHWCRTEQ